MKSSKNILNVYSKKSKPEILELADCYLKEGEFSKRLLNDTRRSPREILHGKNI